MSVWLQLYQTYEANLDRVGKDEKRGEREFTLLPVSHTTQTAHIEVLVTPEGAFHSAEVIPKGSGNTLIPSTEKSASRAGATVAPYPLHDKLNYVAGDFLKYGGEIKTAKNPFVEYIGALKQWVESPYAIPKLKSIYQYVSKGCLIEDLIAEKILVTTPDGRLLWNWNGSREEKPLIYSVVTGSLDGAFVRFTVHSAKEDLTKVWKDKDVHDSFTQFYSHQLGQEDLCYVKGETLPRTESHANKIRNAGDKAKLISANDTSGYTFRGRFSTANEAANISYEVSQKAHNALKWLINRQAKVIDQRVFLVWGNTAVPDPTEDSYALSFIGGIEPEEEKKESDTHYLYAREVAKAIDGYRGKIHSNDDVNVLVMDSATTGRLALLYYRSMNKELYLDRLVDWHETCVWEHRYRKSKDDKRVVFYGAPATKDIAFAAYGPRASDKVVKGLMERMLPCIIDGQAVPFDIIRSAVQRASNPVSMERWEWEKTLSIACALMNKKERMTVALDLENKDRDYLFGRLLAVADVLERQALGSDEKRATNAIRFMNSFSQHPERTWKTIQGAIQPYQARLGARLFYLNSLIDDIGTSIDVQDFNNKPLSGRYLLGFYSQRHELYKKKEDRLSTKETLLEDESDDDIRS